MSFKAQKKATESGGQKWVVCRERQGIECQPNYYMQQKLSFKIIGEIDFLLSKN